MRCACSDCVAVSLWRIRRRAVRCMICVVLLKWMRWLLLVLVRIVLCIRLLCRCMVVGVRRLRLHGDGP